MRSKAIQIYMKPGIREDDLMLRVWEASRRYDRPQDVFRSILRAGLRAMVESGEMPDAIIDDCGLDAIFERRRSRIVRMHPDPIPSPMPIQYPFVGFPGTSHGFHPAHPAPPPASPPAAVSVSRHEVPGPSETATDTGKDADRRTPAAPFGTQGKPDDAAGQAGKAAGRKRLGGLM